MSVKTVFITGVAGFLGKYVARAFTQRGWRVIGADILTAESCGSVETEEYHQLSIESPKLGEVLTKTRPTACVHCAGRASVAHSLEDPADDFQGNTVATFELLNAIRRFTPDCRFLLLSSAAVYGNPRSLPISEEDPVAPLSPYGFHKRQSELIVQEFARVFGVRGLAVRIFSAYGPGLRRQVVWDICERVLTKKTLSLSGTGQESRDFIHAADVAQALAVLAESAPAEGEIYNLATGRETSIQELAHLIIAALGRPVQPVFDGRNRVGDPRNWCADISKLRALGFTPGVSLEDGVAQVTQWTHTQLANPTKIS